MNVKAFFGIWGLGIGELGVGSWAAPSNLGQWAARDSPNDASSLIMESPPEMQRGTLMATDTLTEMVAPPVVGEQRILIPRISWDVYVALGDELDRQRNRSVHLTYDRGSLEIMTTSRPREWYKRMLTRLVDTLVYELNIEVSAGGQMTFRRKDRQRGLEPDEWWWIAHEADMRGRDDYDPHNDPPPDLAVEVEVTNPLLDKLGIYAELGVPEIWRFDGRQLTYWERQTDESYRQVENSVTFSFLRPEHLLPYLRIHDEEGETSRLHRVAEWLREMKLKMED